ncbi:MAG: hypothetical protein KTR25_17085 [Myxococcales bacterium]|nr:hypothetical protein [Myxococcales bacterium]
MKSKVSREIWRRRIQAWRASGLSAVKYAEREGLNVRSLYHWRWQLGPNVELSGESHPSIVSAEQRPEPKLDTYMVRPTFVEISPTGPRADTQATFEMTLRSGIKLKVPQNFDASALERLILALEKRG